MRTHPDKAGAHGISWIERESAGEKDAGRTDSGPQGHAGAQSNGAQISGGLSNSNTGDSGGKVVHPVTPSSDWDGAGKR